VTLSLLVKVLLAAYFLATLFFLTYLVTKRRPLAVLSVWVTAAGWAGHTVWLLGHAIALGAPPLATMEQALAFISWALVLVLLAVELRYRLHVLGSFILPLSFLLLLPSGLGSAGSPPGFNDMPALLTSAWFGIHTVFSLLGFVAFAVAFIAGLMYLIQDRLLKAKRFNALYEQLPSLDLLDEMNQGTILLGFPLLTIGMLSGAIWAGQSKGVFWSWTPKQLLTLVTWFFYLGMLHGRMNLSWRAKRAALLAIVGFAVVGVTFLYVFI
jgi:cytochrome c-type biogenesis protein CcsB